ncbi:hypothetical protein EDD15DRAFT_1937286 [Pisolithus albus]|nr:hypothetical protein EDD15DRAFT_1937286 [Pisolithus albus]
MPTTVSPTRDVLLYFLAIFVPPLAVFFKRGCAADFWINICLTILGWIPGILHVWSGYFFGSSFCVVRIDSWLPLAGISFHGVRVPCKAYKLYGPSIRLRRRSKPGRVNVDEYSLQMNARWDLLNIVPKRDLDITL